MKKIGDFLKEIKKFGKPDLLIREKVAEAIRKYIGFNIDIKDIKYRDGIVYIKTGDHLLKSEVFIKKRKILDYVQDLSDGKNVIDIKWLSVFKTPSHPREGGDPFII